MQTEIHFDEFGRNPDEIFKKLGFIPKISGSHAYWDRGCLPDTYIMIERSRSPFMYPNGVPVCADYVASICSNDKETLEKEVTEFESKLKTNFILRSKKEY